MPVFTWVSRRVCIPQQQHRLGVHDRTEELSPAHATHITPTGLASVERAHMCIPSSSIGANNVFADPSYQAYQAHPRSDVSDP